MNIVFVTDIHGSTDFFDHLIRKEGAADLLILGGDLTNFGGIDEARAVVDPFRLAFNTVLCVAGNVDRPNVMDWLKAEGLSLHGRGVMVGDVGFFGCGGSNITPLNTPTEFDEGIIAHTLLKGHEEVRDAPTKILVSHTPPMNTRVDRMFTGNHVGSRAVRVCLERTAPALCLCGHIHEADGKDWIETTQICNPGAFSARRYATVQVGETGIHCQLHRIEAGLTDRLTSSVKGLTGKIVGYARHRLGR